MLNLRLPTDPSWVEFVKGNISEVLTDHAYCEQKAASNAISLMIKYPEYPDLVLQMTDLAREELEHFERVVKIILKKGLELGRERKDPYVNELLNFTIKNGTKETILVDRLLFAAMIEARSCERFKVLSEYLEDEELSEFYRELMASEANHYALFIKLARKHGGKVDVDKRWKEFLDFEGEMIKNYGRKETIHG